MAQHVKRYKGCCMMCTPWMRGDGKAARMPVRDKRRLGAKRRISNRLDRRSSAE